jgi:MSHA biogenesis protein MshL
MTCRYPIRNAGGLVSGVALLALLQACSPTQQRLAALPTPVESLLPELSRPTPANSPPPAVLDALLPPVTVSSPAAAPERRFDLDVRDIDVQSLFLALGRDGGENIVVHPTVSGNLTLSLRQVSLSEVMSSLRDVYGYDIRRSGAGWQVFPATLQSRMFTVNHLNLAREGRSETRVNSGQLRQSMGAASSTSIGATGSGGRPAEASTPGSASRIETSNRNDFWSDLERSLRLIVGAEGESGSGRAVVVNPQTGIVLVRGMPSELRDVEQFLTRLEGNASRQVMLEAKIIEVELADGFQSGINWAALATGSNGRRILGGMTGGGQFFQRGSSEIAAQTGNLNPANLSQVNNTLTSAFGGIFSLAVNLNDFTAFIELLRSQGDVQVLSSPRISTLNNQKAVIKVGSDEFFVTRVSSTNTTTSTGGTTTNPDIELTPFFSGIALDVTPQINAEGDVVLHVRPAVSEVTDQTKTLRVFGQEQQLPLAFSSTRESDSVVRARNGQIIVIGGLMQDVLRDRRAGLPGLGDARGIGALFRHTQQSRRKTELVILLRPIVVDSDAVWGQSIRGTAERLQGLQAQPPALAR